MGISNKVSHGRLTTDGTVQNLSSLAGTDDVVIKALSTNGADVEIGGTDEDGNALAAGDGYPLSPGEAISSDILNLSNIKVIGPAGNELAFLSMGA